MYWFNYNLQVVNMLLFAKGTTLFYETCDDNVDDGVFDVVCGKFIYSQATGPTSLKLRETNLYISLN